MMKFQIGDTVYLAHAGPERIWITCPECLGSGRLRVILGDNSEVSIECVCCERGYEGSPGRIQTYKYLSETQEHIITGIESELRDGILHIRYKFGHQFMEEENLFATRENAQIRADELILEHDAEELKRIKYKEKQNKTWSWNVSYHRREIKEAQRKIEYHTGKLNAVPKNAKELEKNLTTTGNVIHSIRGQDEN